jgi:hypothetical protein
LSGTLGQRDKSCLRHVLGEVRVTDHPQGSGVNQIHVSPHQFGKSRLGTVRGKSL